MGIELKRIDCMEYMKGLDDNAFELAICDPPYGIGESGKTNNTRGKLAIAKDYKSFAGDDLKAPDSEYFNDLIPEVRLPGKLYWGDTLKLSICVKSSFKVTSI